MEEEKKRGLIKYFIDAIVSPKEAIGEFVDKAAMWPMALLLVAINVALFIPIIPKMKEATLWALENGPKKVPPEQLAMVKQNLSAVVAYQSVVVILTPILVWLFIALAFKFFNIFIGSDAKFKSLLKAAVIASVPGAIATVIKNFLIYTTPASNLNSVSTSAALLLSQPKGFIFGFLTAVDPFTIWNLVLLAIGTAFAMNTSPKKTGICSFVLWAIYAGLMGVIMMFSTAA